MSDEEQKLRVRLVGRDVRRRYGPGRTARPVGAALSFALVYGGRVWWKPTALLEKTVGIVWFFQHQRTAAERRETFAALRDVDALTAVIGALYHVRLGADLNVYLHREPIDLSCRHQQPCGPGAGDDGARPFCAFGL